MIDVANASRFQMICLRCDRPVLARPQWAGRNVHCPHCWSVVRVPPPPANGEIVRAGAPSNAPRVVFHFACPRCSSLLEANSGMSGQTGSCPTCAGRMTVPHVDAHSGRADPAILLEEAPDVPAPVHAYAASGEHAPTIERQHDGTSRIRCPRCRELSPIEADVCANCNAPFSIDGAVTMDRVRRDTRAMAALTAGVLAVPLFMLVLPGLAAIVLGYQALQTPVASSRRPVQAWVAMGLGAVSLMGAAIFWAFA